MDLYSMINELTFHSNDKHTQVFLECGLIKPL